jgi:putative SOS response-associated peptidase YedK
MCGRYTQLSSWSELAELYRITSAATPLNLAARYNVAPTDQVPIVRLAKDSDQRELVTVRWGLVPFWAKDPAIGSKMINARAETVSDKPAFRRAFRERRCLIVADGFYEWQAEGRRKQPYHITLPERRPFAFAGLWDRWQGPGHTPIESCAIIVCEASLALRPIHDRMPVILEPDRFDLWLDGEAGTAAIKDVLKPFAGPLRITAVSPRVNTVRNDDPACLDPLGTAPRPGPEPA